uniref:hypothetical protein n=1 Tax=Sodalis sp. (in: enterobacteria) TaxID=1898979 RepID=UPI00387398BE
MDTGSSNTIMTREALEKLSSRERLHQIQGCNCKLITLGGPCRIEGEAEIGLTGWAARGGKLGVHIVGSMPREYQVIIGCDLLGKVGARIRYRRGKWSIRIGGITCKCKEFLKDCGARIGAINQAEDWRESIKTEFDDIFFKEGDILGVTGRTVHDIPLKQERVTYIKERRYPQ